MNPISAFEQSLSDQRDRWIASAPATRARLIDVGCHYGGRPFVKVLRPKFLGRTDYLDLSYVSGVLLGVFRRLAHRVHDDAPLQRFLGITDDERRLMEPEPLCPDPCAFTRLDSFLTAVGPRFVELNAECPAGAGFSDVSANVFLENALISELSSKLGAVAISTRDGVLDGLLTAWRAAGKSRKPVILITDYLHVPTVPEFHILRDHLAAHGLEAMVEDPRSLTYQGGRLVAQGRAVDLVYRRVLTNEFLEKEDEVLPLFEAYRDGAIVMVNPFRAKSVHKKACFALLTGDYMDQDWLTPEERLIVARHIPWTRRVRECRTMFEGKEIDLLPFVAAHRDRFVLKPNDEYGGKGITIGWEASASDFEAALASAAKNDFVVQDRIRTVEEPFPLIDQDLTPQSMIVDLDPYIYFGKVQGVMARLAAGSLCNVTSGGGQVPVFVVPDL